MHQMLVEKGMSVAEIVKSALRENPDLRMALDAAERARELDSLRPNAEPTNFGNVTTIPLNSQCLVPPEKPN